MSALSQSNHTISINGVNDGWSSVETFTNCSNADNAYFTWDEDFIYFAIADPEADYGNLATFIFLDVNPTTSVGTQNAYAWNHYIETPFKSDFVIVCKNYPGSDYIEARSYDGFSWNQLASTNNSLTLSYNSQEVVNLAVGTDYRELRIKRSFIGSPSSIKISSMTEQEYGSNYRYFVWPSNGWSDGNAAAGQSIPNYYGFNLTSSRNPTAIPYFNAGITEFDGGDSGSETDWNQADNWIDNTLPIENSLVHIPSDKNVVIKENETADAFDIYNQGSLTVKSSSIGTGSLITSNNLNVTVERYIAAATWGEGDDGWHLISSPVAAQSIDGSWSPTGVDNDYDFYGWNESGNLWMNHKETGFSTWNVGNNFNVGQGYMAAYQQTETKTFVGALNNAAVTKNNLSITTGYYSGWHLVGNPFSSSIDWSNANWVKTGFLSTAKVKM
jgi:hypothetical protein